MFLKLNFKLSSYSFSTKYFENISSLYFSGDFISFDCSDGSHLFDLKEIHSYTLSMEFVK